MCDGNTTNSRKLQCNSFPCFPSVRPQNGPNSNISTAARWEMLCSAFQIILWSWRTHPGATGGFHPTLLPSWARREPHAAFKHKTPARVTAPVTGALPHKIWISESVNPAESPPAGDSCWSHPSRGVTKHLVCLLPILHKFTLKTSSLPTLHTFTLKTPPKSWHLHQQMSHNPQTPALFWWSHRASGTHQKSNSRHLLSLRTIRKCQGSSFFILITEKTTLLNSWRVLLLSISNLLAIDSSSELKFNQSFKYWI